MQNYVFFFSPGILFAPGVRLFLEGATRAPGEATHFEVPSIFHRILLDPWLILSGFSSFSTIFLEIPPIFLETSSIFIENSSRFPEFPPVFGTSDQKPSKYVASPRRALLSHLRLFVSLHVVVFVLCAAIFSHP